MAVDLPGEIIDPAGIGPARLHQPEHGQRLALPLQAAPATRHGFARCNERHFSIGAHAELPGDRRQRRRAEALVASRIRLYDGSGTVLPLCAQLRSVGQRETLLPNV